jgi:hypothetical protein
MKPPVIGLVGRRGSGKSLVARRLVAVHGYLRVPFAAPLKDMLRAIGLDEVYLGSLKEQPCPLLCGATPRHAMQSLGSEWGRSLIHPDLWVTLWREKAYQSKAPLIVADDVRFANEAATVRALGGALLRVTRRDAPAGEEADSHVSETEQMGIECNATLRNDYTILDLDAAVDTWIGSLS